MRIFPVLVLLTCTTSLAWAQTNCATNTTGASCDLHSYANTTLVIYQNNKATAFGFAWTENNIKKVRWHFCGDSFNSSDNNKKYGKKCEGKFLASEVRLFKKHILNSPPSTVGEWHTEVVGNATNQGCRLDGAPYNAQVDWTGLAVLDAPPTNSQGDYGLAALTTEGSTIKKRTGVLATFVEEDWKHYIEVAYLPAEFSKLEAATTYLTPSFYRSVANKDSFRVLTRTLLAAADKAALTPVAYQLTPDHVTRCQNIFK